MWQGWGHLSRLRSDISGATAVEYGLLAGLIAVGLMGGIGALSDLVNLLFEFVADETATVADGISDSG
ncbi:MAG: Flp family type IVb pilin [Alphaproteobacteria bacterium]|nr:Flp family type IVb pilin [Alphaproteobacteria bacterium]